MDLSNKKRRGVSNLEGQPLEGFERKGVLWDQSMSLRYTSSIFQMIALLMPKVAAGSGSVPILKKSRGYLEESSLPALQGSSSFPGCPRWSYSWKKACQSFRIEVEKRNGRRQQRVSSKKPSRLELIAKSLTASRTPRSQQLHEPHRRQVVLLRSVAELVITVLLWSFFSKFSRQWPLVRREDLDGCAYWTVVEQTHF